MICTQFNQGDQMDQLQLLIFGGVISLVSSLTSSLLTGVLFFRLEERREVRKIRRQDYRAVCNWSTSAKQEKFRNFDLTKANLSGRELAGADLEDSNLTGAVLYDTDLSGANLINVNLRKATIVNTIFKDAWLETVDFTGARLIGVDFTGANLKWAKLRRAKKIENCKWESVKIDETTELEPELRHQIERLLSSSDNTSNSI